MMPINKNEILLSIVTPFHNEDMEIFGNTKRLVLSALKDNWEWIIVVHNTDTIDFKSMQEMFKDYPNVKLIEKHDNKYTPSSPRNTGIDAAKGRYIYFLDDDDEINEKFLNIALDKLEKDNLDVVIGKVVSEGDLEEVYEVPMKLDFPVVEEGYIVPRDSDSLGKLMFGAPIMLSSKVIRREIIEKNNIRFDENIIVTEDNLFSFECYLKTKKICVLGNVVAYTYIQHKESTLQRMMKDNDFPIDKYLIPLRKIVNLALENGVSPGYYIWIMLGLFGAISENARKVSDPHKILMTEIQKYLPLVKPHQMRRFDTYVSKELSIDEVLSKSQIEERTNKLIQEYNKTAKIRIGSKSVDVMYKNVSNLNSEQLKAFTNGFRNIFDKEDKMFSIAVFVTSENKSIVWMRILPVLVRTLGLDNIVQAITEN